MKKQIKLALAIFAAGFCLSAQTAYRDNEEIAMTKCTKSSSENTEMEMDETQMEKGKQEMQQQMEKMPKQNTSGKSAPVSEKSAAKKVMDGSSSTTQVLKSAAKRAMEEEIQRKARG